MNKLNAIERDEALEYLAMTTEPVYQREAYSILESALMEGTRDLVGKDIATALRRAHELIRQCLRDWQMRYPHVREFQDGSYTFEVTHEYVPGPFKQRFLDEQKLVLVPTPQMRSLLEGSAPVHLFALPRNQETAENMLVRALQTKREGGHRAQPGITTLAELGDRIQDRMSEIIQSTARVKEPPSEGYQTAARLLELAGDRMARDLLAERMAAMVRLVEAYKGLPGNGVGGSLHIVVDDGNVEDENLKFCEQYAKEKSDYLGEALARMLLEFTVDQRKEMFDPFG